MTRSDNDMVERVALKHWNDMRDDDAEIIACGERWKAVAAVIGCQVHGFNDDFDASLLTPDRNIIQVGPKFRAALAAMGEPTPAMVDAGCLASAKMNEPGFEAHEDECRAIWTAMMLAAQEGNNP